MGYRNVEMYRKQRLYVIWNPDTKRTKVGITADIKKRLRDLETISGCRLELKYNSIPLPKAALYESNVHDRFRGLRHIGEWFNANPGIVVKYAKSIVPSDELSFNVINGMLNCGNSVIMIAAHFGVSRQTVYTEIRKGGGKRPIEKSIPVKKGVSCIRVSKGAQLAPNVFQGDKCIVIEIYKNGQMITESFDDLESAEKRLSYLREC